MKKYLLAFLFTAFSLAANAAKSTGAVQIFQQPDGTKVAVQLFGDEYFSWHQTTDGILLTYADKAYYIATTDSLGNLLNSGILAHNADARTVKEIAAIKQQNRSLFFDDSPTVKKAKAQRKAIADYPRGHYCPHSGTVRVPIIIMEYSDMPFRINDRNVWEEYFNGTTRTELSAETRFQGYSSVKQYFADASQGQLDFVFDIYGPYTASGTHDSYGHGKELTLMKEAVALADADIDFSKYDINDNGYVDMVYVLYAGTGRNLSLRNEDLHPQCNTSTGAYVYADGKSINILGCANELVTADFNGKPMRAGIGVTCHEMSHGLGMPDLYWTLSTTPTDPQGYDDWNNCGPEEWDLMDGGENLYNAIWPCQYAAWERDAMGWIDVEELNAPQTVTLLPLNKEGGKACRVTNPDNSYEYYIIENYQSDEWNQYINNQYGTGLMITHVNMTDSLARSMKPNNTYGKPNITILPADGYILALYSAGKTMQYKDSVVTMPEIADTETLPDGKTRKKYLYYYFIPEIQGDPYAGTKSPSPVTSVAAYKNYSGDEDMVNTYPITDITRNSDGSITFNFMGGSDPVDIASTISPTEKRRAFYTLGGVYAGSSISNLPHGIYISNGEIVVR